MREKQLASLCIPFYNQVDFVEDTVKGALSQDYDNLEIIFTDDCSSDGTFEKIEELVADYKGPHKIILNRNNPNMGLVPHTNKHLFELANGDLLFLNGGDDISTPDRISKAVHYFQEDPEVSAVTFSRVTIDKYGNEIDKNIYPKDTTISISDKEFLLSSSFMTGGVALSFRREVLDVFGRLNNDCQTEDSVLRFRALLLGKTIRSSHVGLKYRVHDHNMSLNIYKLKTEPIARQYLKDIELMKDNLSPNIYDLLKKKVDYYIEARSLEEKYYQSNRLMKVLYHIKRKFAAHRFKDQISCVLEC